MTDDIKLTIIQNFILHYTGFTEDDVDENTEIEQFLEGINSNQPQEFTERLQRLVEAQSMYKCARQYVDEDHAEV